MIGTLIRALLAVFLTSALAGAVIVGLPWLPRQAIDTAPASAGLDAAGRALHWYKG
ncbi:MAG: hypothetical protein GWM87_14660, partial [Xanthomonadales bacterium]|nr:hypothetical protein [Xanthomonadales bacterium]NIX14035.1 hypothetical protein [Xanthomonadales bacterium]